MQSFVVYSALCKEYDPSTYQTTPYMTKYEKAAIKGLRLEQLSAGAPTMLTADESSGAKTTLDILEKEIALKKVPFMVLRTLPNGNKELWKLEDFQDIVT